MLFTGLLIAVVSTVVTYFTVDYNAHPIAPRWAQMLLGASPEPRWQESLTLPSGLPVTSTITSVMWSTATATVVPPGNMVGALARTTPSPEPSSGTMIKEMGALVRAAFEALRSLSSPDVCASLFACLCLALMLVALVGFFTCFHVFKPEDLAKLEAQLAEKDARFALERKLNIKATGEVAWIHATKVKMAETAAKTAAQRARFDLRLRDRVIAELHLRLADAAADITMAAYKADDQVERLEKENKGLKAAVQHLNDSLDAAAALVDSAEETKAAEKATENAIKEKVAEERARAQGVMDGLNEALKDRDLELQRRADRITVLVAELEAAKRKAGLVGLATHSTASSAAKAQELSRALAAAASALPAPSVALPVAPSSAPVLSPAAAPAPAPAPAPLAAPLPPRRPRPQPSCFIKRRPRRKPGQGGQGGAGGTAGRSAASAA